MTKKTNPIGFRLYTRKDWQSNWFTLDKKEFVDNIFSDYLLRKKVQEFYTDKVFSALGIERKDDDTIVTLVTDNSFVFTGKNNYLLNLLNKELKKIDPNARLEIKESSFITARYVSSLIATMIKTNRMPWKSTIRKLSFMIMEQKPLGYKIELRGRINNSEKKKTFKTLFGKVSNSTISNNLDYSLQVAVSKVGTISVKTWISYPNKCN